MIELISQSKLKKLYDYNPKSGKLIYKINCPPKGLIGNEAGWINKRGYRKISINGNEFPAHKIVWLFMTGYYPKEDIDHIDRVRSNNAWKNLRLATRSNNLKNQGLKPNNKSGYKGVTSRGNSHSVRLRVNKQRISFGPFCTAKEAAHFYDVQAIKYYGEFAVTNKSLGLLI